MDDLPDPDLLDGDAGLQARLRSLLKKLDIDHPVRFRLPGQKKLFSLTTEEMMRIYRRRFTHMNGARLMRMMDTESPSPASFSLACCFWHSDGNKLPEVCRMGLQSAYEVGYQVLLAAYGEIDVPAGVTVVNAGDFLAHEQFLYLKNEMQRPVVHLADFVRLKMLQRFGGWFHDCDLLHLRLGPTPERAFNFHWFSSLRARPGRRGPLQSFKYWAINYLKKPQDKAFLASPFYMPPWSPLLAAAIANLEEHLFQGNGYAEYNGFMKATQQLITQHGLEASILGPEAFCELDYWANPLKSSPHSEKEAGDIINNEGVFGLAAFWQSSRQSRDKEQVPEKDSTWDRLKCRAYRYVSATHCACFGSFSTLTRSVGWPLAVLVCVL